MDGPNPARYIPTEGQGLRAKSKQEGTEGGRDWLKSQKLHKYWPTFSQWSYEEFISLTPENIDQKIKDVGSTGITMGGKGKLLRSIETLREREETLANIPKHLLDRRLSVSDVVRYLEIMINSPIPNTTVSSIALAIIVAVEKVEAIVAENPILTIEEGCVVWFHKKLNYIKKAISRKPELRRMLKIYTESKQQEKKSKVEKKLMFIQKNKELAKEDNKPEELGKALEDLNVSVELPSMLGDFQPTMNSTFNSSLSAEEQVQSVKENYVSKIVTSTPDKKMRSVEDEYDSGNISLTDKEHISPVADKKNESVNFNYTAEEEIRSATKNQNESVNDQPFVKSSLISNILPKRGVDYQKKTELCTEGIPQTPPQMSISADSGFDEASLRFYSRRGSDLPLHLNMDNYDYIHCMSLGSSCNNKELSDSPTVSSASDDTSTTSTYPESRNTTSSPLIGNRGILYLIPTVPVFPLTYSVPMTHNLAKPQDSCASTSPADAMTHVGAGLPFLNSHAEGFPPVDKTHKAAFIPFAKSRVKTHEEANITSYDKNCAGSFPACAKTHNEASRFKLVQSHVETFPACAKTQVSEEARCHSVDLPGCAETNKLEAFMIPFVKTYAECFYECDKTLKEGFIAPFDKANSKLFPKSAKTCEKPWISVVNSHAEGLSANVNALEVRSLCAEKTSPLSAKSHEEANNTPIDKTRADGFRARSESHIKAWHDVQAFPARGKTHKKTIFTPFVKTCAEGYPVDPQTQDEARFNTEASGRSKTHEETVISPFGKTHAEVYPAHITTHKKTWVPFVKSRAESSVHAQVFPAYAKSHLESMPEYSKPYVVDLLRYYKSEAVASSQYLNSHAQAMPQNSKSYAEVSSRSNESHKALSKQNINLHQSTPEENTDSFDPLGVWNNAVIFPHKDILRKIPYKYTDCPAAGYDPLEEIYHFRTYRLAMEIIEKLLNDES